MVCVLADGMVVDLEHLSNEIADIRGKGVSVTPQNFKLSARATISMPWHRIQDDLEEERLAQSGVAFGSTRRGIAYAYSDKYRKKTLRLGDLLHLDEPYIQVRLKTMLEAKNLELAGCYHQEPMSYPALLAWCQKQAKEFLPYICDTGNYLDTALSSGKQMVLEAQLGAMRDIDYGIFPYTSSSTTIAAYGPIGAGIPGVQPDHVVGVLKAYSTCVGAGPFVAENAMPEEWKESLRKAGGEYGAATGRPRRVGPFDAVASRYGLKCQRADKIALTKLDVLSYMQEIPIIPKLDVLYMTRVQKERFFNEEDYIRLKSIYTLDPEKMKLARPDMPVLHPLPRVDEITRTVDDDPRAAYFDQVQNGVYVRMALIMALLGIADPVTGEKVLKC